jgi:hypothetical protein
MKYMRWSYDQLMACPGPYVDAIVEHSERERAEAEEAERRANKT